LQQAAKAAGGLPPLAVGQAGGHGAGTCTVFVDGLRYDVAVQLQQQLSALGHGQLVGPLDQLAFGHCLRQGLVFPGGGAHRGTAEDLEFEPRVSADGKPLSGHNFRKLLTEHGMQPLNKHETGDPQGQAWTEAGDLDHYGHEHGVRLARDLDAQLDQVIERVT
jgi:hypothetical protein